MDEPQGTPGGGGDDIVVDIPGVGKRAYPKTMPLPQIQQQVSLLMQDAKTATDDANRHDFQTNHPYLARAGRVVTNPEVLSGAASMLPGAGTMVGAGVGAGASLARDAFENYRDPGSHDVTNMLMRAVGHGAAGAVPGVVKGALMKGAPAMMDAAGSMLAHGPIKGGVLAAIKGAMGLGGTAAEAGGPSLAAGGADLASHQFADGVRLVSSEGLKRLVQQSVQLENSGAPAATVKALDAMIGQVQTALKSQVASPMQTMTQAGIQGVTSGADRAMQMAVATRAAAAAKAASVGNRLRAALGLGSATADAAGVGAAR